MRNPSENESPLDDRIANRLKTLRAERGWSLDDLAARCGISRATLSRLENGEVSPTASVLGKLCACYGLAMSRLMAEVETDFEPLVRHDEQTVWEDPETGFVRRSVSPPAQTLGAEVLHCHLPADTRIEYRDPPRPGLEHHLVMLSGALTMTVGGTAYTLTKGDCLRYQLHGPGTFETGKRTATYMLVVL